MIAYDLDFVAAGGQASAPASGVAGMRIVFHAGFGEVTASLAAGF